MLENIAPDTLTLLLRRTAVSALIVGIVGFAVAMFLAPPLSALGVAIGVALAVLNLRSLDKQVARVEIEADQSTKAVRRRIRGGTFSRLSLLTVVVVGAALLSVAFGIGIVSGLVLYQIVFVINVLRVVTTQRGVE